LKVIAAARRVAVFLFALLVTIGT